MRVHRVFLFLFLAGVVRLPGQEAVPNWPAPPYWTPTRPIERSRPDEVESGLRPEAAAAVPTSPLSFTGITPCRIADSRGNGFAGAYGPPALVAGVPRSFTLTGRCGIPGAAEAVSLNVTATNTQGSGHIVVYPQGGEQPTVSTLNYDVGETVANAAVIALGTGGGITVVAGVSGTDLILDTNGYYAPQTVVSNLNGLSGAVTLAPGTDLSIAPAGNTLTIATDATSGNTADTIVRRDASGGFSAGTLTLSGNLVFPYPSTASAGTIYQGSMRLLYTLGASVFLGPFAGNFAITGTGNSAVGDSALRFDTGGGANTAMGASALQANTMGTFNTAFGYAALTSNTTGLSNTAVGTGALAFSTGSGNVAIGSGAGGGLTTGSNNIEIFDQGVAGESNTIRIGTQATQTATYIAGISGAPVAGTPVVVNGSGQLGVVPSSRAFKEDVCDMGESSDGLLKLRPVSFRYKPEYDPTGQKQYGLIAEEVAEVYPDLVVDGKDGRAETIRYHLLVPMLLNEVQKNRKTIESQGAEVRDLKARLERLESAALASAGIGRCGGVHPARLSVSHPHSRCRGARAGSYTREHATEPCSSTNSGILIASFGISQGPTRGAEAAVLTPSEETLSVSEGSSDNPTTLEKSGSHSPSPIAWPYMSTRHFFEGSRSISRKIQSPVILGEARKERCILPTFSAYRHRSSTADGVPTRAGLPPGGCTSRLFGELCREGAWQEAANARRSLYHTPEPSPRAIFRIRRESCTFHQMDTSRKKGEAS